jgi:hypothetical protein
LDDELSPTGVTLIWLTFFVSVEATIFSRESRGIDSWSPRLPFAKPMQNLLQTTMIQGNQHIIHSSMAPRRLLGFSHRPRLISTLPAKRKLLLENFCNNDKTCHLPLVEVVRRIV